MMLVVLVLKDQIKLTYLQQEEIQQAQQTTQLK